MTSDASKYCLVRSSRLRVRQNSTQWPPEADSNDLGGLSLSRACRAEALRGGHFNGARFCCRNSCCFEQLKLLASDARRLARWMHAAICRSRIDSQFQRHVVSCWSDSAACGPRHGFVTAPHFRRFAFIQKRGEVFPGFILLRGQRCVTTAGPADAKSSHLQMQRRPGTDRRAATTVSAARIRVGRTRRSASAPAVAGNIHHPTPHSGLRTPHFRKFGADVPAKPQSQRGFLRIGVNQHAVAVCGRLAMPRKTAFRPCRCSRPPVCTTVQ